MRSVIRYFSYVISMTLMSAPAWGLRSPQRLPKATLTASWSHDHSKEHSTQAWYLKESSIFGVFDRQHFFSHLLPNQPLTLRNNPDKTVDGTVLKKLVDELIQELYEGKYEFSHFTILKGKEFDWKQVAGHMILKFNDHPFIVKLFMENPHSFLHPEAKGFKHRFAIVMNGGVNRYLSGFTRIKNLEFTRHFAPYLSLPHEVDFPRKWFVLPSNVPWFEVKGTFADKQVTATFPAAYAVVADAITPAMRHALFKRYGSETFALCKTYNFEIDPGRTNFMLEKDTNKLVVIDTEHYPTILGMRKLLKAKTYGSVNFEIGFKAIYECLLKRKSAHLSALDKPFSTPAPSDNFY